MLLKIYGFFQAETGRAGGRLQEERIARPGRLVAVREAQGAAGRAARQAAARLPSRVPTAQGARGVPEASRGRGRERDQDAAGAGGRDARHIRLAVAVVYGAVKDGAG